MESKKAKLKRNREYSAGYQGLGSRGNWEILVKGYKLPVISSEDLMYSIGDYS